LRSVRIEVLDALWEPRRFFVFLVVRVGLSPVIMGKGPMKNPDHQEFEAFVLAVEPGLRRALFSILGIDRGREATAEALAWAWEHWGRVQRMDNPTGFLFRVGQSRIRTRLTPPMFERSEWHEPLVEPGLGRAFQQLSESQRMAVILIHGFGWKLREVAELRGTKVTTIQTHLERGLEKLRAALEVGNHA
jgi:DNA-directed RNA polymerase specialized sigma24 family protein